MTDAASDLPESQDATPRWKPLSSIDRRVLGVLVEKAKTTPDAYPLSLNAITTGCNQKSNRDPQMNLESDDVEQSLDGLRESGAVGIIQGIGRVTKYRHYAYQWLGVDKVELAVMAELLLRGAQTEGELRGRAARMEPIAGLAELRPVLASLKSKALVSGLTPQGRGHVVTHTLYMPQEMEKLGAQYQGGPAPLPAASIPQEPPPMRQAAAAAGPGDGHLETLRAELARLRDRVAEMQEELQRLAAAQQTSENELRELRDALGG